MASTVPTWNHEVVHAHGRLSVHDVERFVRGVVARLTRQHEAAEPRPNPPARSTRQEHPP